MSRCRERLSVPAQGFVTLAPICDSWSKHAAARRTSILKHCARSASNSINMVRARSMALRWSVVARTDCCHRMRARLENDLRAHHGSRDVMGTGQQSTPCSG
jgi:hypothetical protein